MARGFAVVGGLLMMATVVAGQPTTPQLSKSQREALRQIVAAVDAASGDPDTADATWQLHVFRASDGSHYVAFSVEPPARLRTSAGPLLLYVRLATASLSGRGGERSAVGEWLAGRRTDPLLRPRTGIAVGEMPNFGAGAIAARGSTASTGSNDLKLMELERERARQEKEDHNRQRRAELEGGDQTRHELLPFEDFDLAASTTPTTGALQRALTAGPGDYELYLGWTDASAKPSFPIRVIKRPLHLPPATATDLSISSVIVADRVATRTAPYPAPQQSAHPYAIGLTDITPARDTVFSRDDRLTVAFQVINAHASDAGKPDVGVTFRIVRVTGDREQAVASLTPQQYTAATMPPDFDLRLGHPIFVAMSAPLATLGRGTYRLKISVTDRRSGRTTGNDADFTIVGTPASLLAEAPSVGAPFRRELALDPSVIEAVAAALRPVAPSEALSRAIDTLRQRRFVELIREEPVPSAETGVRTLLTAVALFALGDASAPVRLQRSIQQNAPPGPALFYIGAARALEGREADAVTAWHGAQQSGMPSGIVTPLLINTHLRRGDLTSAASLLDSGAATTEWNREQAALHIAAGREGDAIPMLESRLAAEPGDVDVQWLLLHALFATVVHGQSARPGATSHETFARAAQAYLANGGPNAPLVTEWLKVAALAAKP